MKTQLEFLKEAVALAEQNPKAKIHVAADTDCCGDFGWTQQEITKVEKTLYYCENEQIMLDVDSVVVEFDLRGVFITEEEARSKMEEVILIYTAQ